MRGIYIIYIILHYKYSHPFVSTSRYHRRSEAHNSPTISYNSASRKNKSRSCENKSASCEALRAIFLNNRATHHESDYEVSNFPIHFNSLLSSKRNDFLMMSLWKLTDFYLPLQTKARHGQIHQSFQCEGGRRSQSYAKLKVIR